MLTRTQMANKDPHPEKHVKPTYDKHQNQENQNP